MCIYDFLLGVQRLLRVYSFYIHTVPYYINKFTMLGGFEIIRFLIICIG